MKEVESCMYFGLSKHRNRSLNCNFESRILETAYLWKVLFQVFPQGSCSHVRHTPVSSVLSGIAHPMVETFGWLAKGRRGMTGFLTVRNPLWKHCLTWLWQWWAVGHSYRKSLHHLTWINFLLVVMLAWGELTKIKSFVAWLPLLSSLIFFVWILKQFFSNSD